MIQLHEVDFLGYPIFLFFNSIIIYAKILSFINFDFFGNILSQLAR